MCTQGKDPTSWWEFKALNDKLALVEKFDDDGSVEKKVTYDVGHLASTASPHPGLRQMYLTFLFELVNYASSVSRASMTRPFAACTLLSRHMPRFPSILCASTWFDIFLLLMFWTRRMSILQILYLDLQRCRPVHKRLFDNYAAGASIHSVPVLGAREYERIQVQSGHDGHHRAGKDHIFQQHAQECLAEQSAAQMPPTAPPGAPNQAQSFQFNPNLSMISCCFHLHQLGTLFLHTCPRNRSPFRYTWWLSLSRYLSTARLRRTCG